MILDPSKNAPAFWKFARTMAEYSARAYDESTVSDPTTKASALICERVDEGDIVVAFKGSKSPIDFLHDAEFWLSDLNWNRSNWPQGFGIKVHHGFLTDSSAITPRIIGMVRAVDSRPQPQVWLTGHSLGGALAQLAALEFSLQGIPVAGVITFGGPRVGNAAFSAAYDTAVAGDVSSCGAAGCGIHGQKASLKDVTFRVVNQNDIVPRMPTWWRHFYRHCGQEVFLMPLPFGAWEANPSIPTKLIYDCIGLYGAYRKREDVLVREHFINAYQDRIKNL